MSKYKKILSVNDPQDQLNSLQVHSQKAIDEQMEEKVAAQIKEDDLNIHKNFGGLSLISKISKIIGYEMASAKKKFNGITTAQQASILKNQILTKFAITDLKINTRLSIKGETMVLMLPTKAFGKNVIKTVQGELSEIIEADFNGEIIKCSFLLERDYEYDHTKYNLFYELDGIARTITPYANIQGQGNSFVENKSLSLKDIGFTDAEAEIINIDTYCPSTILPWHLFINDEDALPDTYYQSALISTLDQLIDQVLDNWTKVRNNFRANKIYGGSKKDLADQMKKKNGISETKSVQNKYVSDVSILAGSDTTNSLFINIKELNQIIAADALIDTINIKSNNKHNEGEMREMKPSKLKILALKVIREIDYSIYYQKLAAIMNKNGLLSIKDTSNIFVELDIKVDIYNSAEDKNNSPSQAKVETEEE